jgi:hypothetical protein
VKWRIQKPSGIMGLGARDRNQRREQRRANKSDCKVEEGERADDEVKESKNGEKSDGSGDK